MSERIPSTYICGIEYDVLNVTSVLVRYCLVLGLTPDRGSKTGEQIPRKTTWCVETLDLQIFR